VTINYRLAVKLHQWSIIAIACPLLSACASIEDRREFFERDLDYYVELPVSHAWFPEPVATEKRDKGIMEYYYELPKSGCRWAVRVDSKTERILDWYYVSDPGLCYLTIRWGGH